MLTALLHSSSGSAGVIDGVSAGSYTATATFSYFCLQLEAEQYVILCDHIQETLHFMCLVTSVTRCWLTLSILFQNPAALPKLKIQTQTPEMR